MKDSNNVEDAYEELDEQIPQLAGDAFRNAFQDALAVRPDVLAVKDGNLVRVDKYGNTTFVKQLPKKIKLSELRKTAKTNPKMR